MPQNTILGIHSNVLGRAGYTEGHAWITVTRNCITRYYGLWPDNHSLTSNNKLSAEQKKVLDRLLRANVTWRPTHNYSSWAHEIIWKVVHEDVDADDRLWFSETPRELGRNITFLEAKDPTSQHIIEEIHKVRNQPLWTESP